MRITTQTRSYSLLVIACLLSIALGCDQPDERRTDAARDAGEDAATTASAASPPSAASTGVAMPVAAAGKPGSTVTKAGATSTAYDHPPANLAQLVDSVPVAASFDMPYSLWDAGEKLRQAADAKTGWVSVIAELAVPQDMATDAMRVARGHVLDIAKLAGATWVDELETYPVVAFTVPSAVLQAMLKTGLIKNVAENALIGASLADTIPLVNAYAAQRVAANRITPLDGTGSVIAILDTGVDNDHPAFPPSKIAYQECMSTGDPATGLAKNCPFGAMDADDLCGNPDTGFLTICNHGTHVAGIAAGHAGATCTAADQAANLCPDLNGVAPNARIVALQIFSLGTNTAALSPCGAAAGVGADCLLARTSDVIKALEKVKTLASGATPTVPNIVAANLSIGGGSLFSAACSISTTNTIMTDLKTLRIATVVAAGNDGNASQVNWPGCQAVAITVGNTTNSDVPAASSNKGPLIDLWAPGSSITSTVPVPQRRSTLSGTSMATPFVAGAFALMRQLVPTLTVDQGFDALNTTGVPITDGAFPKKSRVDIGAALAKLSRQSVTPEVSDFLGQALAAGDFNGDGFTDVAVGVPGQKVGGLANAGAVDVFYGSADSLGIVQAWTQTSSGKDTSEADDRFGASVAVGLFNNDAFYDLAIGSPGENASAGAVHVIYGSAQGLKPTTTQMFVQGTASIAGLAEAGDQFGYSLAAGDFDHNLVQDLAVGAPFDDTDVAPVLADAGSVTVIYGLAAGLAATNSKQWTQDTASVDETAEAGDNFGAALAAGKLNSDAFADLAIGASKEDLVVGGVNLADAGLVHVIYGSSARLSATAVAAGDGQADQLWTQDSTNVEDVVEAGDQFGASLAVGLLNNDAFADLAIGAPLENLEAPAVTDCGAVNVIYGSATGLSATFVADSLWRAGLNGMQGASETSDRFGSSLAMGDFNGDGRPDLAIGTPFEDLEGAAVVTDAGAVAIVYSTTTGLAAANNQLFTQTQTGNGTSAASERFGTSLAGGNFNGPGPVVTNKFDDLAIGAPFDGTGAASAGIVNILNGSTARLVAQPYFASEE